MESVRETWRPVLAALVDELASCASSDWASASLTIRYEDERMCCLLCDGAQRRFAEPTPWLFTLAHDLHGKMERCGCGWSSAQFRLAFDTDEEIDLRIDAKPRLTAARYLPVDGAKLASGNWTFDLTLARDRGEGTGFHG